MKHTAAYAGTPAYSKALRMVQANADKVPAYTSVEEVADTIAEYATECGWDNAEIVDVHSIDFALHILEGRSNAHIEGEVNYSGIYADV